MKYIYIFLIPIILLSSPTAWADLRPYESKYILLQNDDQVGNASRTLSQTPDGDWRLDTKSKAKLFFVKIIFNQAAIFEFKKGNIIPLEYTQLSDTGLSSERRLSQTFDWDNGKDTGKYKNKPWSTELKEGSLSRVTDEIQLQELLKSTKGKVPEVSYYVNYRGNSKKETFVFEAKEDLVTPAGTYNALKYKKIHSNPKRVTYFWFVPELDYIPARIQRVHSGEEQANMLLKSIEFKSTEFK